MVYKTSSGDIFEQMSYWETVFDDVISFRQVFQRHLVSGRNILGGCDFLIVDEYAFTGFYVGNRYGYIVRGVDFYEFSHLMNLSGVILCVLPPLSYLHSV